MNLDTPAVRDGMLLLFRGVIGVVFVAHGCDKFFFTGLGDTSTWFASLNIPQPKLSALLVAGVELIAGSMLVIGLLTTLFAGILALVVIAAIYYVHVNGAFFTVDGGFEYPMVLVASLCLIVVFGPGRASFDGVLTRS